MLHPLDLSKMTGTAWCVPSAISMLTGYPVEKAHSRAAFLQNKSYEDVQGVYIDESILMLHELGFKVKQIDLGKRYAGELKCGPTLKRFFNDLKKYRDEFLQPMIVFTSTHALTHHMGWAGDNWTKRPVPTNDFPKPHRLVDSAYMVI